jgi:hypothetical protein
MRTEINGFDKKDVFYYCWILFYMDLGQDLVTLEIIASVPLEV